MAKAKTREEHVLGGIQKAREIKESLKYKPMKGYVIGISLKTQKNDIKLIDGSEADKERQIAFGCIVSDCDKKENPYLSDIECAELKIMNNTSIFPLQGEDSGSKNVQIILIPIHAIIAIQKK